MKIDWAQNNRFLADVDGTEIHHFECNIEALTKEYGLPPFPGFAHADGAMAWEKSDGMAITFYLYDHYASYRLSRNWSVLQRWLECMGILVVFNNADNAPGNRHRMGASCVVVAARILTWARLNPRNLTMFNSATSPSVLKAANNELAGANKANANFANSHKTKFLSESAVNFLGRRYMEKEMNIDLNGVEDAMQQWPFQCFTVDQLLVTIAQRITEAAQQSAQGQYYFCANSEATGSAGYHWVSCILDIQVSPQLRENIMVDGDGQADETTGQQRHDLSE